MPNLTNIGTFNSTVRCFAEYNGNLYAITSGTLKQFNVNTNSIVNIKNGFNTTDYYTINIYNGNVYATYNTYSLHVYNILSGGSGTITTWTYPATPGFSLEGSELVNPYLYINGTSGGIVRINIANLSDISYSWVNTSVINVSQRGITSYNGFLYTVCQDVANNPIYKINISNPSSITTLRPNLVTLSSQYVTGLAYYNNSLYISGFFLPNVRRVSIINPITDYDTAYATVSNRIYDSVVVSGNLYCLDVTGPIYKVELPPLPPKPSSITIDISNVYIVSSGNLQVSINDVNNISSSDVYYYYSTNGGVPDTNSGAKNNGPTTTNYKFYIELLNGLYTLSVYALNSGGNSEIVSIPVTVYTTPKTLYNCSVSPSSSGNLNVSITETSPYTNYYLNGISYLYYLYTTGTNQSSNILAYTIGANLTTTPYTTNFSISNLSIGKYQVYLIATNSIGNTLSTPFLANVNVYKVPTPTVSIDSVNTITVASGNLQVRIIDSSNTSINGVYYQYALNYNVDSSFANTFVRADVSPYTFWIPSIMDISNTIYVRGQNTVGNSFPAANLQVTVYQTPRAPPQVSFTLVGSGNVQVSINELASQPVPYYYLNNVSYYLYAYNRFGGTNLFGNTSLSVYNIPVGVLANTNSSYGNVVSYVNTGLTANTYTMYVIAKNTVGNSNPVSANIAVYTTPVSPIIDISNTQSLASGTLTVSIIDSSNSPTNGIYYLYSMDGITYGNSGVAKTTNTTYSFTINNTGNALIPLVANTYTLYIKASNTIGNSTTTTAGVQVYTTTIVPTIDAGNTKSLTSGNLTVSITDASNSSTNGIYYLYSTDNITYGNSGVATTAGNTKYTFTIQNTGNALIPLTANTYTLYIKASNPIGNSTTTTATVQVYTTPLSPTIDASNTQSLTSGNLTVFINDTVNSLTNGIYYLYSTDGITYGNSGVAKTTNTTYTFTINNTGNAQIPLTSKTYTLYIAASNPVGNSISNPATAIESVYTTPFPPTIDQGNTKSITSGNLNVGFTDTFNNGNNQVEYAYFLYDSTAAPLFYV